MPQLVVSTPKHGNYLLTLADWLGITNMDDDIDMLEVLGDTGFNFIS